MKNILLVIVILLVANLKAQEILYLTLQPVEQNATEKVYNFIVDDFKNMVGWQFSMLFDGAKMRFKEIRNPILDDMTNHEFNEPYPGVLLTAWIDKDLQSVDYPDPTVAFQLVFELLQPEGSNVCMSESPLAYEFVRRDIPGLEYLSEVNINDDCHASFSVLLNTTAIGEPKSAQLQIVSQIYLSGNGQLTFTSLQEQALSFSLYDLLGRHEAQIDEQTYFTGRNTLNTSRPLSEGIYILRVQSRDGRNIVMPVVTQ